MPKFRAELESAGKTAAGFEVPDSVVAELGGGGRPKVVVELNGYRFRTSIARMGSRYMLGVSNERRAEANVSPGEILDVELELDTAERVVEVPEDLAAALAAEPSAQAAFNALSYSRQLWHVLQVTGAKQPETRARRIAASIAALRSDQAR